MTAKRILAAILIALGLAAAGAATVGTAHATASVPSSSWYHA